MSCHAPGRKVNKPAISAANNNARAITSYVVPTDKCPRNGQLNLPEAAAETAAGGVFLVVVAFLAAPRSSSSESDDDDSPNKSSAVALMVGCACGVDGVLLRWVRPGDGETAIRDQQSLVPISDSSEHRHHLRRHGTDRSVESGHHATTFIPYSVVPCLLEKKKRTW